MVDRYVWWDDRRKLETVRVELRMPKHLHEFLVEVATRHRVSRNSLVCGILAYAADAESRKTLQLEVVPAVRVTERKPSDAPVGLVVPEPTPAWQKRYPPT